MDLSRRRQKRNRSQRASSASSSSLPFGEDGGGPILMARLPAMIEPSLKENCPLSLELAGFSYNFVALIERREGQNFDQIIKSFFTLVSNFETSISRILACFDKSPTIVETLLRRLQNQTRDIGIFARLSGVWSWENYSKKFQHLLTMLFKHCINLAVLTYCSENLVENELVAIHLYKFIKEVACGAAKKTIGTQMILDSFLLSNLCSVAHQNQGLNGVLILVVMNDLKCPFDLVNSAPSLLKFMVLVRTYVQESPRSLSEIEAEGGAEAKVLNKTMKLLRGLKITSVVDDVDTAKQIFNRFGDFRVSEMYGKLKPKRIIKKLSAAAMVDDDEEESDPRTQSKVHIDNPSVNDMVGTFIIDSIGSPCHSDDGDDDPADTVVTTTAADVQSESVDVEANETDVNSDSDDDDDDTDDSIPSLVLCEGVSITGKAAGQLRIKEFNEEEQSAGQTCDESGDGAELNSDRVPDDDISENEGEEEEVEDNEEQDNDRYEVEDQIEFEEDEVLSEITEQDTEPFLEPMEEQDEEVEDKEVEISSDNKEQDNTPILKMNGEKEIENVDQAQSPGYDQPYELLAIIEPTTTRQVSLPASWYSDEDDVQTTLFPAEYYTEPFSQATYITTTSTEPFVLYDNGELNSNANPFRNSVVLTPAQTGQSHVSVDNVCDGDGSDDDIMIEDVIPAASNNGLEGNDQAVDSSETDTDAEDEAQMAEDCLSARRSRYKQLLIKMGKEPPSPPSPDHARRWEDEDVDLNFDPNKRSWRSVKPKK